MPLPSASGLRPHALPVITPHVLRTEDTLVHRYSLLTDACLHLVRGRSPI